MKVIDKKTLWEGKFLRAALIKYSDSKTAATVVTRTWESFERVNCDGIVGIVPFTDNGEVILIRQFRPPINGHVIELPAGLRDKGEQPEDAARRELIEETGYSAGEMIFLTRGPLSSGASSEMLDAYMATGLTHSGIGKRDETEDIEVMKIKLDDLFPELAAMQKAGDYIDLKIYGLVWIAREFLAGRIRP